MGAQIYMIVLIIIAVGFGAIVLKKQKLVDKHPTISSQEKIVYFPVFRRMLIGVFLVIVILMVVSFYFSMNDFNLGINSLLNIQTFMTVIILLIAAPGAFKIFSNLKCPQLVFKPTGFNYLPNTNSSILVATLSNNKKNEGFTFIPYKNIQSATIKNNHTTFMPMVLKQTNNNILTIPLHLDNYQEAQNIVTIITNELTKLN